MPLLRDFIRNRQHKKVEPDLRAGWLLDAAQKARPEVALHQGQLHESV
jgi:hypothetical protein